MVIRCSHCKGMMRLDETRIPKGGGVKIRCPLCQELDYVEDPSLSKTQEQRSAPTATQQTGVRTPVAGDLPPGSAPARRSTPAESEPSIPEDAFQGFRFPAERERNSTSKRTRKPWVKLLIWGIVSLAIVAFFALLVNIVLSGPSGSQSPFREKPSGNIDRQVPPE